MENGKITSYTICGMHPFEFQIKYTETDCKHHFDEINLHTHTKFEVYINMDGDVSFFIKDSLYPVSRGEVIIARPGEQHHCVYRSDKTHKLFWILFDCEKNRTFLDFLQNDSCENFFSPLPAEREELLTLCQSLHSAQLSNEEQLYSFLRILAILKQSASTGSRLTQPLSSDLQQMNDYVDRHIREPLTVAQIASHFYLSQSTLERRFKQVFHMTPLEFIRRKKLILALQLLQDGESVLQAGIHAGYQDCSYFIELFKRYFGCTPYEYKKQAMR